MKRKMFDSLINKYLYLVEQDSNTQTLRSKIIKFFKENPYPKDDQVHKFAEENGVDPHELESQIYAILSNKLTDEPRTEGVIMKEQQPVNTKPIPVGKHNDWPDSKFDPKELKMGIEVEKEHTDDTSITKLIAKDHLAEIPDYYTRLKKMEDEAKESKKKE